MKRFTCETIANAPKKYFGYDPEDPNAGKYTYIEVMPREDCPSEVSIISVFTYSPIGFNNTITWSPHNNDDFSTIFCNEIGGGVYVSKKDFSITRFTEFTHMVLCWVREPHGRWWWVNNNWLREEYSLGECCPDYIVLGDNETLDGVELATDKPTIVQMLNEHDLLPLC